MKKEMLNELSKLTKSSFSSGHECALTCNSFISSSLQWKSSVRRLNWEIIHHLVKCEIERNTFFWFVHSHRPAMLCAAQRVQTQKKKNNRIKFHPKIKQKYLGFTTSVHSNSSINLISFDLFRLLLQRANSFVLMWIVSQARSCIFDLNLMIIECCFALALALIIYRSVIDVIM